MISEKRGTQTKAIVCICLIVASFLVPFIFGAEWTSTYEEKPTDYVIVLDATASMYTLEIPISSDFLECKEKLVPEPEGQAQVEIRTVKKITLARISIQCWLDHKKPNENDRFQLFFIQGNYLEDVTFGFQPISKWEEFLVEIKKEEDEDISGPDKFETDLGAAFFEAFYFCIENSPPDRRKVIIFASDLIESASGPKLCRVIDEISRDYRSRSMDITYVLFLAIAAIKDDYKKVNQCFQDKFPTAIFVPIITNQGVTYEHYDTVVGILESNEDLRLEKEEREKEITELKEELRKMSEERDEYQESMGSPLIVALSIILVVCSLGILLGVKRLLFT